jgi:pimeloyl-ACP methyl ester carboxylesterase
MKSVEVREAVFLATDSCGSSHHPLVLLISGAGAPAAFWPEEFRRDLASAGRHVVRYCHRDTGTSTRFDEPYPIGELLADLMALVDRFGGREMHLVGHSMGGYLAEMAMVGFPGRFASVTSISAGPTVSPDLAEALCLSRARQSTWDVLMQNHPTGDFDRDLPGWLRSWRLLNGSRRFNEEMAVSYTRSLYRGDPRNIGVAANHIHAMRTVPSSLAENLGHVGRPFLVMHGSEDPLVPLDNWEASARLVAGSTMRVLQGAGHMFFTPATWDEIRECVERHTRQR